MATRSSITVKKDGKFKTVYCHFDGYPSGVGEKLLHHYNDQEKADSIVALGDLSCLYESVECPEGHSYNSKIRGYSVFYGRDRGEDGTEAKEFDTYQKCFDWNSQEYNYLWDGEKWLVDGEALTPELIDAD